MGASTNAALARRAVRAANALEYWLKGLDQELQKQNVKFDAHYDKEKTVTLRLQLVQDMMLRMEDIIAEIRGFNPPKGSN
jgi:uncharacterized membrane-anchored protein